MLKRTMAIIIVFHALAGIADAASAPPGLRGKSIIVNWREERIQRQVGRLEFQEVDASHVFRIYISSAGRVFSRQTNTTETGTASTDQVQNQPGARAPRVPSFHGQSMTMYLPFQKGMRRIDVDFASGFASCAARVAHARQAGAPTSFAMSPITKRMVEFKSVTVHGTSCSMRDGNVFGGD